MPDVSIRINGRNFDISCDPGEESRILDLAGYIDSKISSLTGLGGAYNDSHLHVLSLLMITDELFDAREGVVPAVTAEGGADAGELEKELRVKVEAEYAEQLAALQERVMAQDEVIETLRAKAEIGVEVEDAVRFEDTDEGQNTLKVVQHLSDRVNTLVSRLEAI